MQRGKGKEITFDLCGNNVFEEDAVLIESGKDGDVYQCKDCAESEERP